MKRGYKRLLIFQIIIMTLFLLSNFVPSILGLFFKPLILLVLLVLFKILFGFEKDNHRYSKNIFIEILIYLLIYFILYYLFGLITSFARTINYWNLHGIINVIIPTILTIFLRELLRYMMLSKSEGSNKLMITTCIFFIMFDLIGMYNRDTFFSGYTIFIFFAIALLPTISKNVFANYVSSKAGYKPILFYFLVINLYRFFVPFTPNPNEYLYSVIEFIIPMIYLYKIYKYFKRENDEKIIREYNKKRIGGLIIPTILLIVLIYFTSGYFYYQAIVIASGSMTPEILKGDVVLIEKIKNKKDIKIGTIIAYNYEQKIVVHRLIKKIAVDDEMYYYTKGDANNHADNYKITEDMIIGIVNIKVPYVGYPTVWLNEL